MKRLFAMSIILATLSACGGESALESRTASYARLISAPDVEVLRDQNADEDEATRTARLSAIGRLLAEAKRDLEHAEWLVFLRAIHLTEDTARFLINLASLDDTERSDDSATPDLSLAQHMPVVDLDATRDRYERMLTGIRHIGADVAPLPGGTSCDVSGNDPVPNARWCGAPSRDHALPRVAEHSGVAVSYGRIRDGVGRDAVIAWLREHAIAAEEWVPGLLKGLPIHPEPLTVRIVENATDEQRHWVIEAVRIINGSLPHEWKLSISGEPVPVLPIPTFRTMPAGEVHVRFDSTHNHHFSPKTGREEGGRQVLVGGLVFMNPNIWTKGVHHWGRDMESELDRRQNAVGLLVHELIHAMGFLDHPDMVSVVSYSRELTGYGGLPAHYMYPLDREGVLAAYTRLKRGTPPDDIATSLGPWSDASVHVRGVLGLPGQQEMAFGAAHRNGFAQPWAYGPVPDTNLADNSALTETAQWEGRLLGLMPGARAVAGEAELSVQLSTLDGTLGFSDLESWAAGVAPGAIGSGTVWGDGDLDYEIRVRGNTFVQTGGDDGTVTGGFFGNTHEGMAGTLERNDLAAGFGGVR